MFYVLGDTGIFGPYAYEVSKDVRNQLNRDRSGCDFVVVHEDYVAGNDKSHVPDVATCGGCGHCWDDAIVTSVTPAPSARCIWEAEYVHEESEEAPERYAITATVERRPHDGLTSGGVQVPTFYLDARVQGITSIAHAQQVARRIIDPLNAAHRIHLSVVEV